MRSLEHLLLCDARNRDLRLGSVWLANLYLQASFTMGHEDRATIDEGLRAYRLFAETESQDALSEVERAIARVVSPDNAESWRAVAQASR